MNIFYRSIVIGFVLDQVKVTFLMVGHTHEAVDQLFNK